MTERRFGREIGVLVPMQVKIIDNNNDEHNQKPKKFDQAVPDLRDIANDGCFGMGNFEKRSYGSTGEESFDDEDENLDSSARSTSSRMTQEWLEEARKLVGKSPARYSVDKSSRVAAAPPRYSSAAPDRFPGSARFSDSGMVSSSVLDTRRDPFSRSARRQRAGEGVGEEVLTKTIQHSRNRSETIDHIVDDDALTDESPAAHVQKWLSSIPKPTSIDNGRTNSPSASPKISSFNQKAPALPPRQSIHRKSRRSEHPLSPRATHVPPSCRTFKQPPTFSGSNNEVIPSRRSVSVISRERENRPFSPPRNLVEPTHRRSISRSTCSLAKIAPMPVDANGLNKEDKVERTAGINGFLKEQRTKILKLVNGEIESKAKVVLSGPSNSTSTMIAAICYAWLLDHRRTKNKGDECVVIPVMNIRRSTVVKQRQAAWLFNHVGLDANSLLFADEVDLESLMIAGRMNILVVGQDLLWTNGEAGSLCTILTDNYCEDAYDLLQTPVLKKFLLAGILLDTQNLNVSAQLAKTRDAEAVQLLLVGFSLNYRNTLFDQLMQNQKDKALSDVLRHNNGKPPMEKDVGAKQTDNETTGKNPNSVPTNEANKHNADKNPTNAANVKATKNAPEADKPNQLPVGQHHGKFKFSLTKWFGFGSK